MNSSHDAGLILRDYHDQPFGERNYGAIRGLFESPARKVVRHEGIVFVGEFLGTFGFLYTGFMVAQIALTPNPNKKSDAQEIDKAKLLMVAFGFGLGLLVNAFVWFRVTGAAFNPAVSLGLCVMGAIKPIRLFTSIVAQLAGGLAAAYVTDILTVGDLLVANGLTHAANSRTSLARGFFIELIGTAQLMLTIFFLAGEKHRATPMAPLGIGLSLVMIHLAAVNYTGCGVNPARSIGPAMVSGVYKDLWLYIVAPCIGALVACGIYALIKWAGYQDVNPGQDSDQASDAEYILPGGR